MKLLVPLLFSLLFTGCSSLERGMPDEIRKRISSIPFVDVDNLSKEDEHILKNKQKALVKHLADYGYDPYLIADFHIDLGCNLFFEKILPYRQTERTKHVEFFVLRDYRRRLEKTNSINSGFCEPLLNKLRMDSIDAGFFAQRMFIVTFEPSRENDWSIFMKPGRFTPVFIKENLLHDKDIDFDPNNINIALRGEEDRSEYFYAYGCSKYKIPIPVFEKNKVVGYKHKIVQPIIEAQYVGELDRYMKKELSSSVLRKSENIETCQERLTYKKID